MENVTGGFEGFEGFEEDGERYNGEQFRADRAGVVESARASRRFRLETASAVAAERAPFDYFRAAGNWVELSGERERLHAKLTAWPASNAAHLVQDAALRRLQAHIDVVDERRTAFRNDFENCSRDLLFFHARRICGPLNHATRRCTARLIEPASPREAAPPEAGCATGVIYTWLVDQVLGHEKGEVLGSITIATNLKGKLHAWFEENKKLPVDKRVPFDRFLASVLGNTKKSWAEHLRPRQGAMSNFLLNNDASPDKVAEAWADFLDGDGRLAAAADTLGIDTPEGGRDLSKALYIDASRPTTEWIDVAGVASTILPTGATQSELEALADLASAWDAELCRLFPKWYGKFLDAARVGHTEATAHEPLVLAEVLGAYDVYDSDGATPPIRFDSGDTGADHESTMDYLICRELGLIAD